MVTTDLRCFSDDHLFAQLSRAPVECGSYVLEFYADALNRPSPHPTERVAHFFLSPTGGTLRDEEFHIVFYDSRYDTYRGFKPPVRSGTTGAGQSF
jgi:hypothetical protein